MKTATHLSLKLLDVTKDLDLLVANKASGEVYTKE